MGGQIQGPRFRASLEGPSDPKRNGASIRSGALRWPSEQVSRAPALPREKHKKIDLRVAVPGGWHARRNAVVPSRQTTNETKGRAQDMTIRRKIAVAVTAALLASSASASITFDP